MANKFEKTLRYFERKIKNQEAKRFDVFEWVSALDSRDFNLLVKINESTDSDGQIALQSLSDTICQKLNIQSKTSERPLYAERLSLIVTSVNVAKVTDITFKPISFDCSDNPLEFGIGSDFMQNLIRENLHKL